MRKRGGKKGALWWGGGGEHDRGLWIRMGRMSRLRKLVEWWTEGGKGGGRGGGCGKEEGRRWRVWAKERRRKRLGRSRCRRV